MSARLRRLLPAGTAQHLLFLLALLFAGLGLGSPAGAQTVTVTWNVSSGGSVSGFELSTGNTVTSPATLTNDTVHFYLSPSSGYIFGSASDNCGGSASGNFWQLPSLGSDCHVDFAFIPADPPTVDDTTTLVAANSSDNIVNLDISGLDITSVGASTSAHGTATVTGTTITYTPDTGYVGPDSISYTATNAAGTSSPATAWITVNAPEITLDPATLPNGEAGAVYGPATITASGGTGPYSFAMTGGSLPGGLTLADDGTLSGTPGVSGSFTFTVTATDDYGFTGERTYALTIEDDPLPEVRNHRLTVLAGTEGLLDLTEGATRGPFTAATILSHPANDAGMAHIEHEDDAYRLRFAADGAFAGTASLTYSLTNAHGASLPATVTITVMARPDPSQDQEVIGLVQAQNDTAKRFAKTQIANFGQRLEQLHNEGDRRSNSISIELGVRTPPTDPIAYAPHAATPHNPPLEAIGRAAPATAAPNSSPPSAPVGNRFGNLAVWSGGYVNFGTGTNGAINLDHTLVGVSAGVDYRFIPELTAGLGVGYGRDVTDIGASGTQSGAESFSIAAYGSYRPVPGIFIDGLVGYGTMNFDSLRHVTPTGDFAMGSRSGDQVFASLTAGHEYRLDGLLISPYARLSGSHSTLDAFTETGAGIWNLTYGEQALESLSGTLGLRWEYAIPTDWGALTPRGRLEYTHDFEGASRADIGYADIGGLPYAFDLDPISRDRLTVGLGLDAAIAENWSLGLDYRTDFGTGSNSRDHALGIRLGGQF